MRAGARLRTVGVALSLAVVVSATTVASMPTPAESGVSVASADAVLLPELAVPVLLAPIVSWDSLTKSEMNMARASHQAALAARRAQERKNARKVAKAKKLRQDKRAAAALAGTGPIPTAATAKSHEIQSLVKKHFPESQVGNAMAVAACESGHSDAVGATNSDGTTDWGVFQLNDGGTLQGSLGMIGVSYNSTEHAQKLALDTEINVRAAAKIFQSRGWGPWVCAYKIRIVSSLYGNSAGPMYGKFDQMGNPTVDVPTVTVGPGPTKKRNEPVKDGGAKKAKKEHKLPKGTTPEKSAAPVATPEPTAPEPNPSEPDPAPSSVEEDVPTDPEDEVQSESAA